MKHTAHSVHGSIPRWRMQTPAQEVVHVLTFFLPFVLPLAFAAAIIGAWAFLTYPSPLVAFGGVVTMALLIAIAQSVLPRMEKALIEFYPPTRGPLIRRFTRRRVAIDIRPALGRSFGPGVVVRNMVENLPAADRSIEFVLFSTSQKHTLSPWVRSLASEHRNLNAYHLRVPNRLVDWYSVYTDFPWLDQMIGPVGVFHAANYLCVRPRGAAAITTVYDMSFDYLPEFRTTGDPYEYSGMWRAARSNKIVTVSNEMKSHIKSVLSVDESQIAVVHCGVEDSFRHDLSRREIVSEIDEYGLSPGTYFLCVGEARGRKNLNRIVEACRPYIGANSGRQLVTIGVSFDELQSQLGPGAQMEGVRAVGYVPRSKLPLLYGGAIAVIYAPLYEGFGLPVIEGMKCGTPVIGSRRTDPFTGAVEEIADGAALLVDPRSSEAIREAIGRLLADAGLRDQLRGAGIERAEHFSIDRMCRELLAVYAPYIEEARENVN